MDENEGNWFVDAFLRKDYNEFLTLVYDASVSNNTEEEYIINIYSKLLFIISHNIKELRENKKYLHILIKTFRQLSDLHVLDEQMRIIHSFVCKDICGLNFNVDSDNDLMNKLYYDYYGYEFDFNTIKNKVSENSKSVEDAIESQFTTFVDPIEKFVHKIIDTYFNYDEPPTFKFDSKKEN